MVGLAKLRNQKTQRRKKNKNVDIGQRHRPQLNHAESKNANARRAHFKKAHKLGLTPNALHPDGRTPLKLNQRDKAKNQRAALKDIRKVAKLTLHDEVESAVERSIVNDYHKYVKKRIGEYQDQLAQLEDVDKFLTLEQQAKDYFRLKNEMYRDHVKQYQISISNEAKQRRIRAHNDAVPVLEQDARVKYQNDVKRKFDLQIKAMTFKNKITRALKQKLLFPPHSVVTIPSLTPTMQSARIVSWEKKEGDYIGYGDTLCHIRTTDGPLFSGQRGHHSLESVESNEQGYLAKIVIPSIGNSTHLNSGNSNSNNNNEFNGNINVGKPIAIIVSNPNHIKRFKSLDFSSNRALSNDIDAQRQRDGRNDQLGIDLGAYNINNDGNNIIHDNNNNNNIKNKINGSDNSNITTKSPLNPNQTHHQRLPKSYMGLIKQLESNQEGFGLDFKDSNHLMKSQPLSLHSNNPRTTRSPTNIINNSTMPQRDLDFLKEVERIRESRTSLTIPTTTTTISARPQPKSKKYQSPLVSFHMARNRRQRNEDTNSPPFDTFLRGTDNDQQFFQPILDIAQNDQNITPPSLQQAQIPHTQSSQQPSSKARYSTYQTKQPKQPTRKNLPKFIQSLFLPPKTPQNHLPQLQFDQFNNIITDPDPFAFIFDKSGQRDENNGPNGGVRSVVGKFIHRSQTELSDIIKEMKKSQEESVYSHYDLLTWLDGLEEATPPT